MSKASAPSNPTIVRAKHDASTRWFLTLRSSAQDGNLSFEARGILWYLLSKSDDWKVQVPDLMKQGGIGRDKVKKALVELANANYLIRPKKFKNKEGKWDWTPYVLYEAPLTENTSTEPLTEKPSTENQSLENRITDFQSTLQSTEDKVQKQSTEKKKQKSSAVVAPFDGGRAMHDQYRDRFGSVPPMLEEQLFRVGKEFNDAEVAAFWQEFVINNGQSWAYGQRIANTMFERKGLPIPFPDVVKRNGNQPPPKVAAKGSPAPLPVVSAEEAAAIMDRLMPDVPDEPADERKVSA